MQFQFFLQFDRNTVYLGHGSAHSLGTWVRTKTAVQTQKMHKKAILPVRWADGWEAEKSTKIPKK
jgi:hypothetical protein